VWMQQCTDLSTPREWMLSKANKLHGYHTYNLGVHSCSGTSIWLYDGTHTGCAFVLQYYHHQGCVGACELWAVQETHQGFTRRALLAAPKRERPTSKIRPVELPRLARPKGSRCFVAHYARSIDELSGRTTGRLGHIRQDTAHAIGGTARLVRYSIISTSPFRGLRAGRSYTASHAGPTTATALPRRWTGGRATLDTYIWRSRPLAPGLQLEVMTPTSTAGDRTRYAEVCCYTAGLDNAGCATRLRRQAKEERRGPDPSWNR
jgi:hypothetical protein